VRRRASKIVRATRFVQLGMAAPLPFVGRDEELTTLCQTMNGITDRTVLVLRGPAGAGKSRLAQQLVSGTELLGDRAATTVACEPGDHAVAVLARAERAMGVIPGDAMAVLQREPRLLVIDDLHHLAEAEARQLLQTLVGNPRRPHGPGRVLLISRDMPPLRRDVRPLVLDLGGLTPAAARELWDHLEATHGPTLQGACDSAMARTQCLPLALRRAYAEAALGEDAWDLEALPPSLRRTLEALAVLGLPAGPAAVAALVSDNVAGQAVEENLAALLQRQLVDALDDGRFQVHAVLRTAVLAAMDEPRRRRWMREAAAWVAEAAQTYAGLGHSALGLHDPADRMRAEVRYWLAAGDWTEAVRCLRTQGASVLERGGDGEVAGLVALVQEQLPEGDGLAVTPGRDSAGAALTALRFAIAVRRGEVARALALDSEEDPVTSAMLRHRAGRVGQACRRLEAVLDVSARRAPETPDASIDANSDATTDTIIDATAGTSHANAADQRCRAAAQLAVIELALGDRERAAHVVATAFTREHDQAGDDARALLYMSLAAVEAHAGRLDAAREALARAASAENIAPELAARIEARLALYLAQQGRLRSAEEALERALRAARAAGAISAADEIHLCQSQVAVRRGDAGRAAADLRGLTQTLRRRGDEIGAASAEVELAWALMRQGELAAAAEAAVASRSAAERVGLRGLRARATLIEAAIDVAEMRYEPAQVALEALLIDAAADAETRAEAAQLLARVRAATGRDVEAALVLASAMAEELRDDLAHDAIRTEAALSRGALADALINARIVAVRAERAGRRAELAESLALCARLCMRAGDHAGAAAAAARAEREARACGLHPSHALALLVQAGLARAEGRVDDAVARARSAAEEAGSAGLGLLHLVAVEALQALQPPQASDASSDREAMASAAAMLPPAALEAAVRLASDVGLSAACPYRVTGATGAATRLSDASPERLRLGERGLVVDRVSEIVLRNGVQIASLRRRSLLKRLMYLFAGAPGHTFSKEEIVERVWKVEYHPLRHDAALFTNIMRMRRLLGEDGAEIIRVSDDGYRFVPPEDFMYIEAAGEQAAA
jgi:DNA-binding winged helix-turn-helix (wHTH) protein/tetratricopeptide (TPR) repeat protein